MTCMSVNMCVPFQIHLNTVVQSHDTIRCLGMRCTMRSQPVTWQVMDSGDVLPRYVLGLCPCAYAQYGDVSMALHH